MDLDLLLQKKEKKIQDSFTSRCFFFPDRCVFSVCGSSDGLHTDVEHSECEQILIRKMQHQQLINPPLAFGSNLFVSLLLVIMACLELTFWKLI